MYDVEKLVSIVCDYLDAEADYMKYKSGRKKRAGAGSRLYPVDSFPKWLQGIPSG